jgi:hypothetical protein
MIDLSGSVTGNGISCLPPDIVENDIGEQRR